MECKEKAWKLFLLVPPFTSLYNLLFLLPHQSQDCLTPFLIKNSIFKVSVVLNIAYKPCIFYIQLPISLGAQLFCFLTNSVILKGKPISSIIGSRLAYFSSCKTKISLCISFMCTYPVKKIIYHRQSWKVYCSFFQVNLLFSLCFDVLFIYLL